MRIYLLRSRTPDHWLSPQEILERLAGVYADVESDINDSKPLGTMVVDSYRRSSRDGTHEMVRQWGYDPPPAPEVEKQWANAVSATVTIDRSDDARFNVILSNTPSFDITFADSVTSEHRRKLATEVATILDYDLEVSGEPDNVHW